MGSHTAPDWPFDQEQKLRALWAKGLSAAQIARQIPGRSRNAVIGKAKRLNLEGRASPILPARPAGAPAPVRKPRAPKVKPQATTKASPVLGVPFPPAPPEQVEQKRAACAAKGKEVIAATAGVANDNAILLLDRRFGQCAWPVGDPVRPAEQMVCDARQSETSPSPGQRRTWPERFGGGRHDRLDAAPICLPSGNRRPNGQWCVTHV